MSNNLVCMMLTAIWSFCVCRVGNASSSCGLNLVNSNRFYPGDSLTGNHHRLFRHAFEKVPALVKKNQVKFSPYKLINEINPGFEISFQRMHTLHLSTQIAAAYLGDYFQSTHYTNLKGYRICLEEKYYLNRRGHYYPYASMSFIHQSSSYNCLNLFGPENLKWNDSLYRQNTYTDSITIHKQITSLNLLFGFEFKSNHLVVDCASGLGLAYRSVAHQNRINQDDQMINPSHELNIYYLSDLSRKGIILNVPLNLKIGYLF